MILFSILIICKIYLCYISIIFCTDKISKNISYEESNNYYVLTYLASWDGEYSIDILYWIF